MFSPICGTCGQTPRYVGPGYAENWFCDTCQRYVAGAAPATAPPPPPKRAGGGLFGSIGRFLETATSAPGSSTDEEDDESEDEEEDEQEDDEGDAEDQETAPRGTRRVLAAEDATADDEAPMSAWEIVLDGLEKDDLKRILEEHNAPVSGSKSDLILRVKALDDIEPREALAFYLKDGLVGLCEEFQLRSSGTRDEISRRIEQKLQRELEPSARPMPAIAPPILPPYSGARPQNSAENWSARAAYDGAPTAGYPVEPAPLATQRRPPGHEQVPANEEGPPMGAIGDLDPVPPNGAAPRATEPAFGRPAQMPPRIAPPPQPAYGGRMAARASAVDEVCAYIEQWRPSQPFSEERDYEIEMAASMRHHFGPDQVRNQRAIAGGKIDIEVLGVGVELKLPKSRGELQRLIGQINTYRGHYGDNLVVVIFHGQCKMQDITEYRGVLQDYGVRAYVK